MESLRLYGIRNLPVFIIWIRKEYEFSRQTLAKVLKITPREVYYTELGKLPPIEVVDRLKILQRLLPGYKLLLRVKHVLKRTLEPLYFYLSGRMTYGGQLYLDCCKKPPLTLIFNRMYSVRYGKKSNYFRTSKKWRNLRRYWERLWYFKREDKTNSWKIWTYCQNVRSRKI